MRICCAGVTIKMGLLRLVLVALAAAMHAAADSGDAAPTLRRRTLVSVAQEAWDVAASLRNDILYSERCRGISIRKKRRKGGYAPPTLLFGDPAAGPKLAAPDLFCENQSGFLGVEFDPGFQTNRRVYVFAASTLGAGDRPRTNRVIQLTLTTSKRGVVPGSRVDIVPDIYYKYERNANGPIGAHSGGRIRFGPDRLLYITTGTL